MEGKHRLIVPSIEDTKHLHSSYTTLHYTAPRCAFASFKSVVAA